MDLAHRNQLGWFHKPQAAPPSSVFLLYLCLYQRACREVVFLRETGLHQIKASRVAFSSMCFICRRGLCSLSGERDVLSCFFWYFPESSFHIHVTKNFPPNFFSPRPVFKTLLLWAVLSEKPQLQKLDQSLWQQWGAELVKKAEEKPLDDIKDRIRGTHVPKAMRHPN